METPDILNSKIKKIRIELPNYSFSHSSSGDSPQPFIGRKRILEKLKKLVEDSPDEPGVYLVAGNRGVGKTSLVCEVIKETSLRTESGFFKKLKDLLDFKSYKENHSRLYLRINFGHKLRDEKDILRLIARTLSTEYGKYRRSLWRMLPWWAVGFGILSVFAYFLGKHKSIVTGNNYINSVFSKFVAIFDDNICEFLRTLGKGIVSSETFSFLASFLLVYLFYILLFRSRWITHFFVTHRTIARRLKALNRDITHSTERESSMRIGGENSVSGIAKRTRKSRNVADAREIEKELQDILDDMRRIPPFMCRPKVVIVFDELDKVEPGDANTEKETPQTKASMFSIGATRERQTEILRILSNLKYFLSTARAKFIFIAGREMFDIHLADVSERNNYIGSIFNAVIHVPSFLTDHPTGTKSIREESGIASLPEEFVCRRLLPRNHGGKPYNLKSYREYLEKKIFCKDTQQAEIQKTIAVLQQFIIYLTHVSKGAPKKMMQLFESFVEIRVEKDRYKRGNTLLVRRNRKSEYFLTFSYYKQYTLGIIAYLITPIFYRLAESNIKEHSDKLLVSSLRFVDFLFKFHKHSFTWKHLDISPELLETNHAPELKSVVVDLLNYLAQVHINKSSFSLYDYKFDSWIANEIFTMTKTDEVFSALFSFSLDETLSLKKHYQDLLETAEREYRHDKDDNTSVKYIDAISSLQIVLGDLHYYDDELEVAAVYYKNAVEMISKNENNDKNVDNDKKNEKTMNPERLYLYVRNKLKLGMIHERRRQYDFAYLTYGGICKRIIHERNITKRSSNDADDNAFQKMTYEGLKQLYLPFIARLQMLEQSHIGGITSDHLAQLEKEHKLLTFDIDPEDARLLDAEFYSRIADVLYFKNSDLMDLRREEDKNLKKRTGCSCTACHYYHMALSVLLNLNHCWSKSTVVNLLSTSVENLKNNHNMKYCTILARILSDWGNVFFSCDISDKNKNPNKENKCYIHGVEICNTIKVCSKDFLDNCTKYIESEEETSASFSLNINSLRAKKDIAFAMYSISSEAYRKASLYKRSAYQIYKMLRLLKHYNCYNKGEQEKRVKALSQIAIHYLWYVNEDLNVLELNKRKKDFGKDTIEEIIPLQTLLVDSEITKIRVLVKELELKSDTTLGITPEKLRDFYDLYITSPYKINYSIGGRIYRLRLKSKVNYKAYQLLIYNKDYEAERTDFWKKNGCDNKKVLESEIKFILEENYCDETATDIFGEYFNISGVWDITLKKKVRILDNLIADSIYSLVDITQLTKTMGETYVFTNSFLGSVHQHLSFWIRLYETYEVYKKGHSEIDRLSRVEDYLKKYLDEEWRELLSGYRENQRALSHYYQALEMHSEGRAYHDMIDTMCYVRDDYNDRSDHFNIAEERHLIVNGKIRGKIDALKNLYKDSKLYDADKYFGEG